MKYLLLGAITEAGQQLRGPDLEAWMAEIVAWYEKQGSAGVLADAGYQLDFPHKAKTVRARGVNDGPYIESKEVLAGYSLLGESACERPARRGFLYRIPDNRIFVEPITDELRRSVEATVVGIRKTGESQLCPEPTNVRGRCVECEFANYCADIW